MRNKLKWFALIAMIAVLGLGLFMSRNSKQFYLDEGIVWTTEYHITYESDKNLSDSIQAALMRVDNSASKFNKSSLISRINRNETVQTDDRIEMLYRKSVEVNKLTDGAFDPTVSPLMSAWGFGYKSGSLPSKAAVDSIMCFVGIEKTKCEGRTLLKNDNRTEFDFSAIAKGLGCDEVGRVLQRNGVTDYIVEIGGEIASMGHNAGNEKWHVSIDKPIDGGDTVIHNSADILAVEKAGIATSGNYRNYKVIDGKKVVHTINPKTGFPEMSNLLSATVVADDCMTADAYATACMVMGLDRTMNMMKSNSDIGVMLIYADKAGNMKEWHNEKYAKYKKRQ